MQSDTLEIIENLYYIIEFVSYFIFSFTGSLLKEMYNTNSTNEHEFSSYNVIASTIIATLFTMAFKEFYFGGEQEWAIMAFLSFVFGLIGFELFITLSSINGIRKFLSTTVEEAEPKTLGDTISDHQEKREQKRIVPKPHVHIRDEDD